MESTPNEAVLIAFLARVDQQIAHAKFLAETSGDDHDSRQCALSVLADLLTTKCAVEEKLRG
jgi:hypothetical protein